MNKERFSPWRVAEETGQVYLPSAAPEATRAGMTEFRTLHLNVSIDKRNRQPGGTGCLKEGFEKGSVTLVLRIQANIEEIMKLWV